MCRAVTRALGLAPPRMPEMPPAPPPPPPRPPPPPVPDRMMTPDGQPAADAAGDAARRQAQRQRGRATTILTGAQGLVGTENIARPTATKVLLGG